MKKILILLVLVINILFAQNMPSSSEEWNQLGTISNKEYVVQINKHGAVLKPVNEAEKIYLGKDCDVYSKTKGKGKWGFFPRSPGFRIEFSNGTIIETDSAGKNIDNRWYVDMPSDANKCVLLPTQATQQNTTRFSTEIFKFTIETMDWTKRAVVEGDFYDYFPEGGLRNFYSHVKPSISYESMLTIYDGDIFLNNVSTKDKLNLNAHNFNYYNPKFVDWLTDNLIKWSKDTKFKSNFQNIYNLNILNIARTFYVSNKLLNESPSELNKLTKQYKNNISNPNWKYDYAESGWAGFNDSYRNYSIDGNVMASARAFWIRRNIDGSKTNFEILIDKLIFLYDGDFKNKMQSELKTNKLYEEARELYEKACNNGDASSCHNLGVLYHSGAGIRQDGVKATTIYRKACDMGYMDSCSSLINLYEKACADDDAGACYGLGDLYSSGNGVKQNKKKASQLYEKACAAGLAGSCNNLGNSYNYGEGVRQDKQKAGQLYKKACDGGDMGGCFNLKNLYTKKVVKKNISKFKCYAYSNKIKGKTIPVLRYTAEDIPILSPRAILEGKHLLLSDGKGVIKFDFYKTSNEKYHIYLSNNQKVRQRLMLSHVRDNTYLINMEPALISSQEKGEGYTIDYECTKIDYN